MTNSVAPAKPAADGRMYSPGLEGVIAAETALGYVDGEHGRLLYRGYRIGDLVERGTYPAVANLLWTGEWNPNHHLPTTAVPEAVPDRVTRTAEDREADGRPPDRRLHLGHDPDARLAANARAGPRPDRLRTLRPCCVCSPAAEASSPSIPIRPWTSSPDSCTS